MKNRKDILKAVVLITIVISMSIFIFKNWNTLRHLNIENFIGYLRKSGKYCAILFIIIYAIKPLVLLIPSSMLSLVAGTLFGPIKGFIFNILGFFLSGSLAFCLSRVLGQPFVDKLLKDKAVKLKCDTKEEGFKIIFLLRFPPIFPYDPISYGAGLTKMRYRDFVAGSLLGVLPETLCYSYMGKSITNPFTYKFIIPLILVVLTTIIAIYFYKKSNKNVVEDKKKS
ncbi:TVP38/TMEM64 family protein [Clostridium niameyense]|uniref:TVP38/TMEM64 family membrane protein n=1 Tax=Clostridium niameyense TaxID=1622073 RepID=A0A6M0RA82_9CLOT|nr:TVP38/TMEM64 family protein [Clostridium niameyense]NEZ47163.1 TVP38/TMEM64 family protein [Clostridium niameyense]